MSPHSVLLGSRISASLSQHPRRFLLQQTETNTENRNWTLGKERPWKLSPKWDACIKSLLSGLIQRILQKRRQKDSKSPWGWKKRVIQHGCCSYELRDQGSIHRTCAERSQMGSQCCEGKADTSPHPQVRSYPS